MGRSHRSHPSHSNNFDSLFQALERIAAGRRPEFVRNISGISQIRDSLCNKPVIQLLRVVDLVPAWHAASMEMRDPLKILLDVAADVSVHDLCVIDVVENLHARRVYALDNVHRPRDVIAHLILSTETWV